MADSANPIFFARFLIDDLLLTFSNFHFDYYLKEVSEYSLTKIDHKFY